MICFLSFSVLAICPLLSFFVNDSLRRLVPLLLTASLIGKSIVSSDHKEARRISLKNVKNHAQYLSEKCNMIWF